MIPIFGIPEMKDPAFWNKSYWFIKCTSSFDLLFLEYSSGILEIKENMDTAELQEKLNQSKSFLVFNKE